MKPTQLPLFLLLTMLLFSNCTHVRMAKMVKEMEELKNLDFSWIVQPEFIESKEIVEHRIQELYFAEKVVIGAGGIGGVIGSPTEQEDNKYWLQCILLNPDELIDLNEDSSLIFNGRIIAQTVLDGLTNVSKYDKIQISFTRRIQEGPYWKSFRQNKFFSVPGLEVTKL
ncbi:MAG TPA: hypothetical protein VFG10_03330 [Saprospiraceae bacterium]|nr:hypothetical protein [Saprospiraceae bacterium]